MKCKTCRKSIPDNSKYCPLCGAQIPIKKKTKKLLWIAALAMLLIAAAGASAWLVLRPSAGDAPGESTETETTGPVAHFDCGQETDEVDYAPEAQLLGEDGKVEIPPFPVREGFAFGGWYQDPDCTERFDFTMPRHDGLTVYARWIAEDAEEAGITEAEWNIFSAAERELTNRTGAWVDESGYTDQKDLAPMLDAAEKYAEELKQQGTITYYRRNEHLIYMEFASCIPYVFCPQLRDRDENGEGVILSFDPFENESLDDANTTRGACSRKRGDDLQDRIGAEVNRSYNNGAVSIDALQDLPDCEYFLWHGHGIYLEELHSVLVTGSKVSEYKDLDPSEAKKIKDKNYVMSNEGRLGVTERFFRRWIRRIAEEQEVPVTLPNGKTTTQKKIRYRSGWKINEGLVYLATCHSAADQTLVQTFLDLGAEVVFGITGKEEGVYLVYDQRMMALVLRYMSGQGPMIRDNRVTDETDPVYYPAQEALEKAHDVQEATLAEKNLEYLFCSYIIQNGKVLSDPGVTVECFGPAKTEYTLVSGIEGALRFPEGPENLEGLKILLSDGKQALMPESAKDEFGNRMFFLNDVEPGTWKLELQYCGVPIRTEEQIAVARHRFTDLGALEIPLTILQCRVLDAENGEPIGNGSISCKLQERSVQTKADSQGAAELRYLPEGAWTLIAEAEGYQKKEIPISVEAGTRELDLGEITLERNTEPLVGPVVSDGISDYYWHYRSSSFEKYGEFARFSYANGVKNQLVRRTNGEETVILEDYGGGDLCCINGRIYYERMASEDYGWTVCSVAADGSDGRVVRQQAALRGVSSDGTYLVMLVYETGKCVRWNTSTETEAFLPDYSAGFLAVHNDRVYYSGTYQDYGMTIESVAMDGTDKRVLFQIAKERVPGYEWAMGAVTLGEIRFPTIEGIEYIFFSYGFVEGSAAVYQAGSIGWARLDGKASDRKFSVPSNCGDFTVTEQGRVEAIKENRGDEIDFSPVHWWYTGNGRLYLIDPVSGESQTVVSSEDMPAFFDGTLGLGSTSGSKLCSVAEVQRIGDRVYFRAEQSVRAPETEYSWRENYRLEKGALFVVDLKSGTVTLVYSY